MICDLQCGLRTGFHADYHVNSLPAWRGIGCRETARRVAFPGEVTPPRDTRSGVILHDLQASGHIRRASHSGEFRGEVATQEGLDLADRKGLVEERVGLSLRGDGIVSGGREDDGRGFLSEQGAHGANKGGSIHARHHEVGDDQRRARACVQLIEGGMRARRENDGISGVFDDERQRVCCMLTFVAGVRRLRFVGDACASGPPAHIASPIGDAVGDAVGDGELGDGAEDMAAAD